VKIHKKQEKIVYLYKSFNLSIFLPFYLPLNVDLKSRVSTFNFLPFFLPIFSTRPKKKPHR
ncbi:hypothetical protein, partial [Vibrio parahaemolyticus]|uniref:hypothetical protein n=1 Tax=Vibrio parahaemolyticus TaxID=670 RepID=UPI00193D2CCA